MFDVFNQHVLGHHGI